MSKQQAQNARTAVVVVAVGLVGQSVAAGLSWASLVWFLGLVWLGLTVAYWWCDGAALRAQGRAVRAIARAERGVSRADLRGAREHWARVAAADFVARLDGRGDVASDLDEAGAVRFELVDDEPEADADAASAADGRAA